MDGGRAPARKGARVERQLARLLCELGLPCARVPLSGAIGCAYSGDIDLELCGRPAKIQVKARHEFRTLHSWLNGADLLVLKADRQPALAVLPVHLFAQLAVAAQRAQP
jgi:Holliday junction resolvase